MNQATKLEPSSTTPPPSSSHPKQNNPYARMSQRRAIACTICAKAKTKCDKAVPSCSRCTAKGFQCEPRSTRRTSDNNYQRNTKKHLVSPKRYPTTNSLPAGSRHSSPRSVPSSDRRQLARAMSHMDYHPAAKMTNQQANFTGLSMLTPLQTYPNQIIDECYSYSSSPEQNLPNFSQPLEKNALFSSGRLTPQTPDSFLYQEPLPITGPYDQCMSTQAWSDDGQMPAGLGLENEIPGIFPMDAWSTPEPEVTTSMGLCDPTAPMNVWPHPPLSVSPPQIPNDLPLHTRSVPSLSESSVQDSDSPNGMQDEWSTLQPSANQITMVKTRTPATFFNDLNSIPKSQPIWEDLIVPRSSTY